GGVSGVAGCFINPFACPFLFDDETSADAAPAAKAPQSFMDVLRAKRRFVCDALGHLDSPFGQVVVPGAAAAAAGVGESWVPADSHLALPSSNTSQRGVPLFSVMLVLQNQPTRRRAGAAGNAADSGGAAAGLLPLGNSVDSVSMLPHDAQSCKQDL